MDNDELTPEEALDDARMNMAAAAWRIAHLAGKEALIEDLRALLLVVSSPTWDTQTGLLQ